MYHSISRGSGPTCIAPDTFDAQLAALREHGYSVVSLGHLHDWRAGRRELPQRCAAITFDDAFADFATEAAPLLSRHGFSATVFVPTSWVDKPAGWAGAGYSAQPLLSWGAIRDLAADGTEFGSHSCSHTDLTTLTPEGLATELSESKQLLEDRLGSGCDTFAAPYGRTNLKVRQAVSERYRLAVGVELASAHRNCDIFDIPRLEMHYFRDPRRWGAFLDGRAGAYFAARQFARSARGGIEAFRRRFAGEHAR
jgi:peptidoglycan/xylan/chitin deacetylase (PgdA/CDA1 family)